MEDSAQIQEDDIRYANKRRKLRQEPLLLPLYTVEDAQLAAQRLVEADYGVWTSLMEGVEFQFTDAGHIIGSACVHLRITENGKQRILTFSGDLGRYRDAILRSPAEFPQ
ncbi:MAG: hypothetical protein RIQ34_1789, partial [Bacteroidota bacterium]